MDTRRHLNLKAVDHIIECTMAAISDSRDQMYDVAEHARNECIMLEQELRELQTEVENAIAAVDQLTEADRTARDRLVVVSRDYYNHSYRQIQNVHEEARKVHGHLEVAREREKHLRLRRDELARRLRNMKKMAERAERMVSRVGLVMDYLSSDLEDLSASINDYHRQQAMGFGIIRAQEEERRRVAREIHDGPAQTLAGVVMKLDYCQLLMEREPNRLGEELAAMAEIARTSLRDVRKTIFDLRPMALDELGLEAAVKGYTQAFEERSGVQVNIKFIDLGQRFPLPLEIAVFRLVQEALVNIDKHAGVKDACAVIEARPEEVMVEVSDEGCGFDVAEFWQEVKQDAFGLVGMRERVEMLEGSFELNAHPGQGTRIRCRLPIQESEGNDDNTSSDC